MVAHVDGATGRLVAELPDGTRLPRAVLEELSCNARLTGLLYDRDGKPIWRTHSVRTATEARGQASSRAVSSSAVDAGDRQAKLRQT